MPNQDPPLIYGITDSFLLPGNKLYQAVDAATQAGVRWIQYRAKNQPATLQQQEAQELLDICLRNGAKLIINDDPGLAKKVGAHGVHLGQNDQPVTEARALLGDNAIIGVTCHDSLEFAHKAHRDGASYVAFGRFFASSTKPEAPLAPLNILTAARRELPLPIVAIGGITRHNAVQLLEAGAHTLASCNSLFEGNAIKSQAEQLLRIHTTS